MNTLITTRIIGKECCALMYSHSIFKPKSYVEFHVRMESNDYDDSLSIFIERDGGRTVAKCRPHDLTRSLDWFSPEVLLPAMRRLPQWQKVSYMKLKRRKAAKGWYGARLAA